jgi:hypothetical protein
MKKVFRAMWYGEEVMKEVFVTILNNWVYSFVHRERLKIC